MGATMKKHAAVNHARQEAGRPWQQHARGLITSSNTSWPNRVARNEQLVPVKRGTFDQLLNAYSESLRGLMDRLLLPTEFLHRCRLRPLLRRQIPIPGMQIARAPLDLQPVPDAL